MKMGLVNEINSVSFCLIDDEKEELTLWISNLGRDRMSNTLFLPFDYEPSWAEVIKLYNKLEFFEWKEHNLIRAYEGEELIAYIDYIKLVLSDKR